MTYESQEISTIGGAPYFLYQFSTVNETWYYTDFKDDITWNNQVWSSFSIKHTEVKQSNELSKNSMGVSLPLVGDFASLFVGWSPDSIVSFTLRRGHFGASDTLVYWKGRVVSHSLQEQVLSLKCESIFTSMRRAGLRGRFTRNCRHALYNQSGCKVDKSSFAVPGIITNVNDLVLTIAEAAGESDGWFTGGMIEFADGSTRMIISHTGDEITLTRVNRHAIERLGNVGYGKAYGRAYGGFGAILYPGCDRTLSTCLNKFNNLDNQGGFRWIPNKNPMAGSSIL